MKNNHSSNRLDLSQSRLSFLDKSDFSKVEVAHGSVATTHREIGWFPKRQTDVFSQVSLGTTSIFISVILALDAYVYVLFGFCFALHQLLYNFGVFSAVSVSNGLK